MGHKDSKAQSFTKSSSCFLSVFVTLWRLPIAVIQIAWLLLFSGSVSVGSLAGISSTIDVAAIDRERILTAANQYLKEMPLTITSITSSRSAGGLHDYFSEAITGGQTLRTRTGLTSSAMECPTPTTSTSIAAP